MQSSGVIDKAIKKKLSLHTHNKEGDVLDSDSVDEIDTKGHSSEVGGNIELEGIENDGSLSKNMKNQTKSWSQKVFGW